MTRKNEQQQQTQNKQRNRKMESKNIITTATVVRH